MSSELKKRLIKREIASSKSIAYHLTGNQSWSLGQNLRDRDETQTLALRGRDFKQKVEARPRLECAETRHETFETKRLQKVASIFNTKFWTF